MFRSYPIAKTLVVLIAFGIAFFLINHHRPVKINEGYHEAFSHFKGELNRLCLSSISENRKAIFRLYDIDSTQVDSVYGKAEIQQEPPDAYKLGFNFNVSADYSSSDLAAGIYFWDNFLPLIVKNRGAKIIVIFPFLDRQASSNQGGRSFYSYNSDGDSAATKLSLNRPLYLNHEERSFFRWINQNLDKSTVSFATDQDLETLDHQFPQARLLIFFGNSRFWSVKQIQSFKEYNRGGGNALIIGAVVMKDRLRHNAQTKLIEYYRDPKLDPIKTETEKAIAVNYKGAPYFNYEILGMDYDFGGTVTAEGSRWNGFRITAASSPIFEKTRLKNGDVIPVSSTHYSGSAALPNSTLEAPQIDIAKIKFHRAEVLGYDVTKRGFGMIAAFQKNPKSGYILNIGSAEWALSENLNRTDISQIIKNGVQILSSGQSPFSRDSLPR